MWRLVHYWWLALAGTLSTYDGTPFDGLGHQIVASNGHLHAALLAELARARQ
jgi:hypothetical protein